MTANIPEALIWIVLLVGWVIIQAILKSSSKTEKKPPGPDEPAEDELDDFLRQLTSRAGAVAEQRAQAKSPPEPARAKKDSARIRQGKMPADSTPRPPALARPATGQSRPADTPPPPFRAPAKKMPKSGGPVGYGRPPSRTAWLNVLKSIKGPEDWRRAVVYREIMGPPKALRSLEMASPGRGE